MSFNFLLQIETVPTADPTDVSVWSLISQSNWLINLGLLVIFGFAIYVFVERYMAFRRALREEDDILSKIKTFLMDGNIEAARKFCSNSDNPSARILEKGIVRLGKPIESISVAIENTSKIEITALKKRVAFLRTAAGAAPLLGFLGTVSGIITIFITQKAGESIDLQMVASKMTNAAEGLAIGFIALIGYNYLNERIAKIVYAMESTAIEFMDVLNEPGK